MEPRIFTKVLGHLRFIGKPQKTRNTKATESLNAAEELQPMSANRTAVTRSRPKRQPKLKRGARGKNH